MSGLTKERIIELIEYNPDTGIFLWIKGPGFRRDLDGAIAGEWGGGRWQIMIDGVNYRAHRLAFLFMIGRFPNQEVDHIDGNPLNNRWSNLREVDRQTNQQNLRKAHSDNATGFLGVTKKRGKYQASICVNGRRICLGCHETPEKAHSEYIKAKRKYHEGCTI